MPDIQARFKRLRHLRGLDLVAHGLSMWTSSPVDTEALLTSDSRWAAAAVDRDMALEDARRRKQVRTGARGELPLVLGDVGGYRVLCGAVDIDGKPCPE